MWLVLCDAGDVAAHWAYLGLKKRGLSPIEIVLPEELTKGARLTQSISTVGSFVRCELADGRTFDSANLRGVLNRWMQPPVPDPKLDAKDRDYTAQETMAFFVSWLAAVPCRMLNPPTPYCLGGPMLDPFEWMHLAGRAGVPVPRVRLSSDHGWAADPVFGQDAARQLAWVIGDRVLAEGLAPAPLLRLAQEAGAPLLGAVFAREASGEWIFDGCEARPELRAGGNALLDALAETLR